MAATTGDSEPESPRRRPFGIGDSMILIAAIALLLFLYRWPLTSLVRDISTPAPPPIKHVVMGRYSTTRTTLPPRDILWELPEALLKISLYATGLLMGAVLLLRIRQPRPALSRMIRQPGILACGLVVLPLLYCVYLLQMERSPFYKLTFVYFCCVVPLTWLILWRNKSWAAAGDWVDRLGRRLGWSWIGGTTSAICFHYAYRYFH